MMLSRTLRALLSAFLCTLPLTISAAETSNASGTMKVAGRTTALHYAYAMVDAAGTRVLISSKPMSATILAAEAAIGGKGKPSPFYDLVRKGEAAAVELFIKPDGALENIVLFDRAFETPLPAGGNIIFWYEPYRMSTGWTGGRSRTRAPQEFFDTKWEYDVAFFAPAGQKFEIPNAAAVAVQRKEIDTREKARMVAPGGGEEGAMYLAFHKNMEAGNAKALHEQMTPAMKAAVAEQMQLAKLTDSDLASWGIMHGVPPGKVEVIGGVRDADATLLELRKTTDREVKFGTATIVRHEGRWKVAEENW